MATLNSKETNQAVLQSDKRALSLDFLAETGEFIASFGLAVTAAASSGRLDIVEFAFRQARTALLEAVAEFRTLVPPNDGGANG